MTFEVDFGGRTRVIAIEPTDRPGRFRVTLDHRPYVVDANRSGEFGLSLLVDGPPAGVTFSPSEGHETGTVAGAADLQVTPTGDHGQRMVHLEGRYSIVTLNGRRSGRALDAGANGDGEIAITAPMPGRVVRVLVEPGDSISARQGVVVVEAMKMENELRAPRAGRIKEISVAAGSSVEAGRVLAVIE